jgi:hypothetical protein
MISLEAPTPILRIFDEAKAREFYLDYLGFQVDWEHRFGDNFPLYMQVSRGACLLHLSEHHGDACPGSAIRIPCDDIERFHAELDSKDYRYAKPGIERTPWNTREITITDPFRSRLIFFQPIKLS